MEFCFRGDGLPELRQETDSELRQHEGHFLLHNHIVVVILCLFPQVPGGKLCGIKVGEKSDRV